MSNKIVQGDGGRPLELNAREGEPVLSRLIVTGLAGVVLATAARWGLPIDEGTATTIATVLVAGVPIVGALWARRHSWSGETVAEVLAQARRQR